MGVATVLWGAAGEAMDVYAVSAVDNWLHDLQRSLGTVPAATESALAELRGIALLHGRPGNASVAEGVAAFRSVADAFGRPLDAEGASWVANAPIFLAARLRAEGFVLAGGGTQSPSPVDVRTPDLQPCA